MKRRIIKQGHNTLTMTLPSRWAKKYDIKAGDEIDIIEQGKDLKINVEKGESQEERAVVDISGVIVPIMWRLISAAYRAGYDEIKIIYENKGFNDIYTAFTYNTVQVLKEGKENELSPLEAIQALVNRFVGFELIEQKSNYCIIKDLGHTTSKEFDNTLRRIFLLLQTMSSAVVTAAKTGNKEDIKGAHILDTNLDRFEDFCLRVLNKEGYSDFKKTPTMYNLIFLLEMVGDEYKRMGIHMFKMKEFSRNMIKFITHTDNLIKLYYEMFYTFTKEKAENIYQLDKSDTELFEQVSSKLSREELELMHHIKKIDRFIISLVELRIDLGG